MAATPNLLLVSLHRYKGAFLCSLWLRMIYLTCNVQRWAYLQSSSHTMQMNASILAPNLSELNYPWNSVINISYM